MAIAPSFQDLLDVGRAEAQARRSDLRFGNGDVTTAMLHAGATMADAVVGYVARAVRATYIDGARQDDLTTLVNDHTSLQRDPATAAQVTVRFSRTSGGGGGTIASGTRVGTAFDADGKQVVFTTDSNVVVGAGNNGPFDVVATCSETGPGGNVATGTVTKVLDSLFDSFTVTNADAAGGGNDEETDEALRERVRAFFPTLQRGTLAALEHGALQVPSVRIAKAFEDVVGAPYVTVYVADEDGNSNAQMLSDVLLELDNWRCAGIPVRVVGGSPLVVDLQISLDRVREGFDAQAASAVIEEAVVLRMKKLKVSEIMYLDSIIAAVIAAYPDDIFDVSLEITVAGSPLVEPADVVPLETQIIRPGTISVA